MDIGRGTFDIGHSLIWQVLAAGGFGWENSQIDGIWTYPLEEVKSGIRNCFADLKKDVQNKYGMKLTRVESIGVSAMMHGYLAFDREDRQLVPFRTWRNNITAAASEELTRLFNYPVPQRWSIAHLYQAILNDEAHVAEIAGINTLAGWVHEQLTGKRVLGVGDASGMFPVDTGSCNYDVGMIELFDKLVASCGFKWELSDKTGFYSPFSYQS